MGSAVSRRAGEQSGAHPDLTLPHSLARTRAAWGATNRRDSILPRCMRARGGAHLRALRLLHHCRDAPKPGGGARVGSRRPSTRQPIGKWWPGRGRPATRMRRQRLVQKSPARSARHAPGSAKTMALDHNNISRRKGCRNPVPASCATSLHQSRLTTGHPEKQRQIFNHYH